MISVAGIEISVQGPAKSFSTLWECPGLVSIYWKLCMTICSLQSWTHCLLAGFSFWDSRLFKLNIQVRQDTPEFLTSIMVLKALIIIHKQILYRLELKYFLFAQFLLNAHWAGHQHQKQVTNIRKTLIKTKACPVNVVSMWLSDRALHLLPFCLAKSIDIPFSMKSKTVVTAQNLQSIKTFVTLLLAQYCKNGNAIC